jgi:hypothetical protein
MLKRRTGKSISSYPRLVNRPDRSLSKSQILAILRQAEGGVPVPELYRAKANLLMQPNRRRTVELLGPLRSTAPATWAASQPSV